MVTLATNIFDFWLNCHDVTATEAITVWCYTIGFEPTEVRILPHLWLAGHYHGHALSLKFTIRQRGKGHATGHYMLQHFNASLDTILHQTLVTTFQDVLTYCQSLHSIPEPSL